jgi:hypothetical protein
MGVRFNFLAAAIEEDVNAFTNEIIQNVFDGIVQRTPVDTGLARSNWQVNLGSPSNNAKAQPYSPIPSRWKPRPGVNPGGSRSETDNARAASVLAARVLRTRTTDQPAFITNNLPYIQRLLDGWSPQSPASLILAGVSADGALPGGPKFAVTRKVMS